MMLLPLKLKQLMPLWLELERSDKPLLLLKPLLLSEQQPLMPLKPLELLKEPTT